MTYEKAAVEHRGNPDGREDGQFRLTRFVPIGIVFAGLAFGSAMGLHEFLTLDFLAASRTQLKTYVADNFALSLATFFFVYVFAVAFSFPAASILTIFAGFLFGWFIAGTVVAFAATAGATLLFLAARFAFADFFREKVGGRLSAMADGFREDAFNYLFVLRLAPIFPFWLINIAPAFFNIPTRIYVAATLLGILPGTYAYAYLGQGVDSVIMAAKDAGRDIAVADLVTRDITIAFGALALVAAMPVIVKKIRKRNM